MLNSDQPPVMAEANLLGTYQIGRLLGRGAFANVYHGRHLKTEKSVAIKVVSKKRLAMAGCQEHVIKREITIMHRMRHAHIIRLQEVLATKTKIYFIMELANGGELFSKVAKGRFSEELCRRYFQQLLSAVGHCHAHGIFHRDLKPENLLLDENWNLKVTDFGLSAMTEQIHSDGMLHTVCGTPAYVAPEILAKKGYDGAQVDIWSCGVILFVLNAGYLPFNDQNLMLLYRKIYKGEFRCPNWTSPELKVFLRRLLDTNPKTRITLDEIMKEPWLQYSIGKGIKLLDTSAGSPNCLNAFDIISFSSGCNLFGLLSETEYEVDRFLSRETAEVILKRVEEESEVAGVRMVGKMGWGGRLEGHKGNFVAVIRIGLLIEKVMVVEVETEYSCNGGGIWKKTVWPQLSDLIYR